MKQLAKNDITAIHAHNIEIFSLARGDEFAGTIQAKIGFHTSDGKPVAETKVMQGLEQNETVVRLTKELIDAVEDSFLPFIGAEDTDIPSEMPTGIIPVGKDEQIEE